MIESTFCHLPGISKKREFKLWHAGITSWDIFLNAEKIPFGQYDDMKRWKDELELSRIQLAMRSSDYFKEKLPACEYWRLFPAYRNNTAFLDIETTGNYYGYITTISIYDGEMFKNYIKGKNLQNFADDIKMYEMIITFNGKHFDVPYIHRELGCKLDQIHIDLRYEMKSIGCKGGLKKCEKESGVNRGRLDGLDGYDAVLLWKLFLITNDMKALETLLAYNNEDTIHLETLMIKVYNEKTSKFPFETSIIPENIFPAERPFCPNTRVVKEARKLRISK